MGIILPNESKPTGPLIKVSGGTPKFGNLNPRCQAGCDEYNRQRVLRGLKPRPRGVPVYQYMKYYPVSGNVYAVFRCSTCGRPMEKRIPANQVDLENPNAAMKAGFEYKPDIHNFNPWNN